MGLAEGVAAGDECDGFLVVHGHACKSFTDVLGRGGRVRRAVRAFRVHIDEAHLNGRKRVLESAALAVALVAKPFFLGTPVDVLLGLVDVVAAAAKTEGLEAHGFERNVAGEDHEVGPGQLLAVFLLDRPKQTTGLVEVGVVRPAVERRETLRAGGRTAAAVGCTVGTGGVPGHADHERTVMTPVCRPPLLAVRKNLCDLCLHFGEIELLELFGVVERRVHRVTGRRILVQNSQVQLVRPPIAVRTTAETGIVHDRALARFLDFSVHI